MISILLVLLVLILLYFISFSSINKIKEAYGGGRGGYHRGGGGGRGGYHMSGGGRGVGGYLRGRPHHYGGGYRNYGYASWYSPWYLFRSNYCKDGCTNIGNGIWGCQYPGYGSSDCQFSSDCDGCNYY